MTNRRMWIMCSFAEIRKKKKQLWGLLPPWSEQFDHPSQRRWYRQFRPGAMLHWWTFFLTPVWIGQYFALLLKVIRFFHDYHYFCSTWFFLLWVLLLCTHPRNFILIGGDTLCSKISQSRRRSATGLFWAPAGTPRDHTPSFAPCRASTSQASMVPC